MPQDHRPHNETRKLMIEIVSNSSKPMTRTQIVNGLNRKKTPHLISMMDVLVDEGIFQRDSITLNNGVSGYVYSIVQADTHSGDDS